MKNYINENRKRGRTENVCCSINCAHKMRILVSQSKRLTERQSHVKSQMFGDLRAREAQRCSKDSRAERVKQTNGDDSPKEVYDFGSCSMCIV